MKTKSPASSRSRLRVLGKYALILLVGGYITSVAAGYLWLRQVRKVEHLSVLDVAFFRVASVRRALAVQQFAKAEVEVAAKNVQGAYLMYSSAMRNDPAAIAGRLKAAEFFRSVGAAKQAQAVLEDGLALAPEDPRMIAATFEFLLNSGRDRRALVLLRQHYGENLAGANALTLQQFELQATLAAEGPAAARKLLEQHHALPTHRAALPVVARVYWETAERLKAVRMLAEFVAAENAAYEDYARLAGWQNTVSDPDGALATAQRACDKFPEKAEARVLRIEMTAAVALDGQPDRAAVLVFLRDFAGKPEPLLLLAALAGNKGWVDLAQSLYCVGTDQLADLGLLALAYADALTRANRFADAEQVLTQIENQAGEGSLGFLMQLRQRQVLLAGARGDGDGVRDYARRLATSLRGDDDRLETYRRLFQKIKLPEAVAEFTPAASRSAIAARQ